LSGWIRSHAVAVAVVGVILIVAGAALAWLVLTDSGSAAAVPEWTRVQELSPDTVPAVVAAGPDGFVVLATDARTGLVEVWESEDGSAWARSEGQIDEPQPPVLVDATVRGDRVVAVTSAGDVTRAVGVRVFEDGSWGSAELPSGRTGSAYHEWVADYGGMAETDDGLVIVGSIRPVFDIAAVLRTVDPEIFAPQFGVATATRSDSGEWQLELSGPEIPEPVVVPFAAVGLGDEVGAAFADPPSVVWHSADGTEWAVADPFGDHRPAAGLRVLAVDGAYVMEETTEDGRRLWTSTDGISWTDRGEESGARLDRVTSGGETVYGNSRDAGIASIWSSGDGVAWEATNAPSLERLGLFESGAAGVVAVVEEESVPLAVPLVIEKAGVIVTYDDASGSLEVVDAAAGTVITTVDLSAEDPEGAVIEPGTGAVAVLHPDTGETIVIIEPDDWTAAQERALAEAGVTLLPGQTMWFSADATAWTSATAETQFGAATRVIGLAVSDDELVAVVAGPFDSAAPLEGGLGTVPIWLWRGVPVAP